MQGVIKKFPFQDVSATYMHISRPPLRFFKHHHQYNQDLGLPWHSFISEVYVENAETLTMI